MRKRTIALALLCMTASAVAAPEASVSPSTVVTFKDWTVGCDNGLACQAVALMPEDSSGDNLSVVVQRAEGIAALPVIRLTGVQNRTGTYRILIDGKSTATASVPVDSEFITVTGAEAIRLVRMMAKGRMIGLSDNSRANLGSASLAGAAAALRYIDTYQGRADSTGAMIATGKKKATVKKVALPVVSAGKITPSEILPDAAALVALSDNSPCAAERFGPTEDSAYSLGTGANGVRALVMLNCGAGAYNQASGIYTGQRDSAGKWSFALAKFDYVITELGFDHRATEQVKANNVPVLINADWDAATQSITSYNKARGIGDCGSSHRWVWDGAAFRLTAATVMEECRGSLEWIPVWRAEVKLTL